MNELKPESQIFIEKYCRKKATFTIKLKCNDAVVVVLKTNERHREQKKCKFTEIEIKRFTLKSIRSFKGISGPPGSFRSLRTPV